MYTIGIDLGGTNIKAGVVDSGCHIVGTAKCKTCLLYTSSILQPVFYPADADGGRAGAL